MTIHFIIPGDLNQLTGGYIYNRKIIEGLVEREYHVRVHNPGNDFPFPGEDSLTRSRKIFREIPPEEPVIIDSLALGPLEEIIMTRKERNPVIALIHLPLFMNPAFTAKQREIFRKKEKNVLRSLWLIITVSRHTTEIIKECGIDSSAIKVIYPQAEFSTRRLSFSVVPEKLLCIANYTRNKGYLTLIKALRELKYIRWTLEGYGNRKADLNHMNELENEVKRCGLRERIFFNGSLPHEVLSRVYSRADLFVLPSEYESYPMVLAEALTHGIPVVAADAGGIKELVPQGAGRFFTPGSPASLRKVLKLILTDHNEYASMCAGATQGHENSGSWKENVDLFEYELQKAFLEFHAEV